MWKYVHCTPFFQITIILMIIDQMVKITLQIKRKIITNNNINKYRVNFNYFDLNKI